MSGAAERASSFYYYCGIFFSILLIMKQPTAKLSISQLLFSGEFESSMVQSLVVKFPSKKHSADYSGLAV